MTKHAHNIFIGIPVSELNAPKEEEREETQREEAHSDMFLAADLNGEERRSEGLVGLGGGSGRLRRSGGNICDGEGIGPRELSGFGEEAGGEWGSERARDGGEAAGGESVSEVSEQTA